MEMTVRFPGRVAVEAVFGDRVVRTDQPAPLGEGSAPSPFDLFLASLATCAGYYALRFCQEREIATEGLGVSLSTVRDPERKRAAATVRIALTLPKGFPEKYESAIQRAVDQCAVKKHVVEAPVFETTVVRAAG